VGDMHVMKLKVHSKDIQGKGKNFNSIQFKQLYCVKWL